MDNKASVEVFYGDVGNHFFFQRKGTGLFVPHIQHIHLPIYGYRISSRNSHSTSRRLNAREQKFKAQNSKTENRKRGVSDGITEQQNHRC